MQLIAEKVNLCTDKFCIVEKSSASSMSYKMPVTANYPGVHIEKKCLAGQSSKKEDGKKIESLN